MGLNQGCKVTINAHNCALEEICVKLSVLKCPMKKIQNSLAMEGANLICIYHSCLNRLSITKANVMSEHVKMSLKISYQSVHNFRKLKNNGDNAPSCFRPLQTGKIFTYTQTLR
jgi:hypothetical protein